MEFEINNNMTESCNIINKIHILFAEKKTMWHVWSCTLLKCHDFNTIMSWLLCICCHLSVIYILALCYCFEAWTRDAKWGNKQYTLHRFITRYNLLFKTCISKDGIKTINFNRDMYHLIYWKNDCYLILNLVKWFALHNR